VGSSEKFSSGKTSFVDDSAVYRVVSEKISHSMPTQLALYLLWRMRLLGVSILASQGVMRVLLDFGGSRELVYPVIVRGTFSSLLWFS
jgi:hypothetical protein